MSKLIDLTGKRFGRLVVLQLPDYADPLDAATGAAGGGNRMSVYELIQELAYYPADAKVSVKIGDATTVDISDVRPEIRPRTDSIVIEVEL